MEWHRKAVNREQIPSKKKRRAQLEDQCHNIKSEGLLTDNLKMRAVNPHPLLIITRPLYSLVVNRSYLKLRNFCQSPVGLTATAFFSYSALYQLTRSLLSSLFHLSTLIFAIIFLTHLPYTFGHLPLPSFSSLASIHRRTHNDGSGHSPPTSKLFVESTDHGQPFCLPHQISSTSPVTPTLFMDSPFSSETISSPPSRMMLFIFGRETFVLPFLKGPEFKVNIFAIYYS